MSGKSAPRHVCLLALLVCAVCGCTKVVRRPPVKRERLARVQIELLEFQLEAKGPAAAPIIDSETARKLCEAPFLAGKYARLAEHVLYVPFKRPVAHYLEVGDIKCLTGIWVMRTDDDHGELAFSVAGGGIRPLKQGLGSYRTFGTGKRELWFLQPSIWDEEQRKSGKPRTVLAWAGRVVWEDLNYEELLKKASQDDLRPPRSGGAPK
jgi:hypothetical protein